MFQSGDNFPGKANQERIDGYTKAEHIIRSRFDKVFGLEATLTALTGTDYGRNLDKALVDKLATEVKIIVNLPKVIVAKFASMVTTGLALTTGNEGSQGELDKALAASKWPLLEGRLAFRCAAYGNAVVTAYRGADGAIRVSAWEPWCWFPETGNYDSSTAQAHTFAWQVEIDEKTYLLQERHSAGRIERSAHIMSGGVGGTKLRARESWDAIAGPGAPPEFEDTGVDRPLVAVFGNPGIDETLFGDSDILGNDSLINELTNRISQIAEILDKHADPKMTGPQAALRKDPNTGEAKFDIEGSRFLPVENKDDPEFAYLVWESQLEYAMAELDRVARLLCVTMSMCPDLIGLGEAKAGVEATDTLRIRAFNTLTEIGRKRPYFAQGCMDMCDMLLQFAKQGDGAAVNVAFGDPLPASATERAKEIQALRVAGTISVETAVRRQNPTWTEKEISAEVERLGKENEPVNVMDPGFA